MFSKKLTQQLKGRQSKGEGCFGAYYQISKRRGVKVFFDDSYSTIEEAINSREYKKAVKESNILQTLTKRGSDFTPKSYGVKIIKKDGFYRIALVMQHLGTTDICDRDLDKKKENKIIKSLRKKLRELKFNHTDLHTNNVMWFRKKYWAIDFSSGLIKHL